MCYTDRDVMVRKKILIYGHVKSRHGKNGRTKTHLITGVLIVEIHKRINTTQEDSTSL